MASMLAAALIVVGSIPIVWASRRCLLRPSSHGFYRFFAFEAILCLIVLNAPKWFATPFAPRQLASWLLLSGSLVPAVSGFLVLRRLGHAQPVSDQSTNFAFENTTNLVTSGPYRYIRHPLYASLLFLAWGVLLKAVTPATVGLSLVATGALVATAKVEERENIAQFGPRYRDYMARTRLFVPFVF